MHLSLPHGRLLAETKKFLRGVQGHAPILAIALLMSVLDLMLLERKYNIFSGGFQQVDQLHGLPERLRFAALVLALQLALAAFAWQLVRQCGKLLATPPALSRYRFVFFYLCASLIVLLAKYQIISYFGDLLSFAIVRNLGGGDLRSALVYSLEEGALFAGMAGGGILAAWLLYRFLTRRLRALPAVAPASGGMNWTPVRMLVALAVLLTMGFFVSNNPRAHRQLHTVTPYRLASELNALWRPARVSALSALGASTAPAAPAPAPFAPFGARRDNLVLIVSESTRADMLDMQVDGHPLTPAWRALAAEGQAGRHYYSHTGFTTTSLKAIFKGNLNPEADARATLFSHLKKNGYQIAVVSGQDESFGDIGKVTGAEQAADIFFDARTAREERVSKSAAAGSLTLSNERVVRAMREVAAKLDWTRPVFIYVNLQAAHFPYRHKDMPAFFPFDPVERGDIAAEQAERVRLTYANAVASSDHATGQIVQAIKDSGAYARSLVVVSGDHGESLYEDGVLGHGTRLTEQQTHTLLVANRKLPALDGLMGQADLAAALLQGMGARFERLPPASTGVLQYLGDVKAPSEIGFVYADGTRLTLNNEQGEVSAAWLPRALPAGELAGDEKTARELRRLVAQWKAIEAPAAPLP
jgi:glucan phosphoethanolaminetransferase (alkaline phosphatase superfamily)